MNVIVVSDFTRPSVTLHLRPASNDLHSDHNDALKKICYASRGSAAPPIIKEDLCLTPMCVDVKDGKGGQKQNRGIRVLSHVFTV